MSTLEEQILLKANPDSKFRASNESILPSKTDHDHFPYTRYYRGEYKNPNPMVTTNKAGWNNLRNDCYKCTEYMVSKPNDTCFQLSCNTTLPCRDTNGGIKKSGCSKSPGKGCINLSP